MYRSIAKRLAYVLLSLQGLLYTGNSVIYADTFSTDAYYHVYFTPIHNCTAEVIRTLKQANKSIYVQAYFLTEKSIVAALIEAKERGIDVHILLDKNHPEHAFGIQIMRKAHIPIWIDHASGIAHNKVMIIDQKQVITGSFNFSYSANRRNRENLLIIQDKGLAKQYLENWKCCQIKAVQEKPIRSSMKKQKTDFRNQQDWKKVGGVILVITLLMCWDRWH